MRVQPYLLPEQIKALHLGYLKDTQDPVSPLISPYYLQTRLILQTPLLQKVGLSFSPTKNPRVRPEDRVFLLTQVALNCLNPDYSRFGFVEELLQEPDLKGHMDFLEQQYLRVLGLFGDMQYTPLKDNRFQTYRALLENHTQECREYLSQIISNWHTLETQLNPRQHSAVVAYNHINRVMGIIYGWEPQELYVDYRPPEVTLDEKEERMHERVNARMTYGGEQRTLYNHYLPHYLISSHYSVFLHALSRPAEVSPVTSRFKDLTLTSAMTNMLNLPQATKVTYHPIPRLGEAYSSKRPAMSMTYYYSYPQDGCLRVLAVNRKLHQAVQLHNRMPMTVPDKLGGGQAYYKGYNSKRKLYEYQLNGRITEFAHREHLLILRHNAALHGTDPDTSPVKLAHVADSSPEDVFRRLLHPLSRRALGNTALQIPLLPQGYAERKAVRETLRQRMLPLFEQGHAAVQAVREAGMQRYLNRELDWMDLDNLGRQEARKVLVQYLRDMAFKIPRQSSMRILQKSVQDVHGLLELSAMKKLDLFARVGMGRLLYRERIEPFRQVFEQASRRRQAISTALEKLSEEDQQRFNLLTAVFMQQLAEGGFLNELQKVYWGGVSQHLLDIHSGPYGIYNQGSYAGRDGLPQTSQEFLSFLEQRCPEFISNPIMVANRLSKTHAYLDFHLSPFHKLPWPNLHRNNPMLQQRAPVFKEPGVRVLRPEEPSVVLYTQFKGCLPGHDARVYSVPLMRNLEPSRLQKHTPLQQYQPVVQNIS